VQLFLRAARALGAEFAPAQLLPLVHQAVVTSTA
jgi:hypothetical protein